MRKERVSEWERDIAWALHKMPIPTFFIWLSSRIKFSSLCFACLPACLLAYSMRIEWWDFFYFVLFTTLFFAWRSVVRTYARRKDILKLNITTTMATTTTTMQWHQNDTIGTLLFAIDVCTHIKYTPPRLEYWASHIRIKIAKSSPRKHSTINIRPHFLSSLPLPISSYSSVCFWCL